MQHFPSFIHRVSRFSTLLLVSLPVVAGAATLECTAKVSTKLNDTQMKKMTNVNLSAAQATAIESVGKANLDRVISKELEVENGCLLYSFDLRLRSKEGIDEVQVDAVSGKVISQKHETVADEVAEKSEDAHPVHANKK
jgi:diphthamide synthase (EF-2-diphthine--ammonia ligase)